jgi:hypothetical protein
MNGEVCQWVESSRTRHNGNNKQNCAVRCKSVCVPQALPLSIAVTGRASADVRFLQHHMVLRLTTRRPTLSTDLNHRNSLQWKRKYNCDRSSTFKMFTDTDILVCSSCDLVHWKWTLENVGRYKGDAESAWYSTFALATGSQKTHLNGCTWTPPSCCSNDKGWPMKNGYCVSATAIQISAAYSCPHDGNSRYSQTVKYIYDSTKCHKPELRISLH